ncbi:hypothetical protein N9381_03410 [Paracoccaceae bacterium]|nr:hypothetical protein [Paracoccaceae bacterium]
MTQDHKTTSAQQQMQPPAKALLEPAPRSNGDSQLFDGDETMFKQHVSGLKIYGEYGVGRSTEWLFRTTDAQIYSIDSDARWVKSVQQNCQYSDRLHLQYCDVGPVGDWGWPLDDAGRDNYTRYTNAWWRDGINPDLVLIDGRFRVCCFLTSLKYAKTGTKIIFDDYFNRPEYHLVEEFLKPSEACGRQALFVQTNAADQTGAELDRVIDHFQFVKE